MAPGPALRRRLDNLALRWHAQLDSDWSDRSLPWILAGAGFVLLSGLALARTRMFGRGRPGQLHAGCVADRRGHPARLTILGSTCSTCTGRCSSIRWPCWPGYPPRAEMLVVVQSAALAVTVLPLWRLARRVVALRVGATTCLVVAYLFYPAVQQVNVADFHPVALAIPALVAMSYWAGGLDRPLRPLPPSAVLPGRPGPRGRWPACWWRCRAGGEPAWSRRCWRRRG